MAADPRQRFFACTTAPCMSSIHLHFAGQLTLLQRTDGQPLIIIWRLKVAVQRKLETRLYIGGPSIGPTSHQNLRCDLTASGWTGSVYANSIAEWFALVSELKDLIKTHHLRRQMFQQLKQPQQPQLQQLLRSISVVVLGGDPGMPCGNTQSRRQIIRDKGR